MSGIDLSGDWIGFYNYDFPCPPTRFDATLRDSGGFITGLTTETFEGPDRLGTELQAVIEGQREGVILRFTKTYDDFELLPDSVAYEGTIQPGGDEIEGSWSIEGDGAGSFMMVRARKEAAAEERRVEEEFRAGR